MKTFYPRQDGHASKRAHEAYARQIQYIFTFLSLVFIAILFTLVTARRLSSDGVTILRSITNLTEQQNLSIELASTSQKYDRDSGVVANFILNIETSKQGWIGELEFTNFETSPRIDIAYFDTSLFLQPHGLANLANPTNDYRAEALVAELINFEDKWTAIDLRNLKNGILQLPDLNSLLDIDIASTDFKRLVTKFDFIDVTPIDPTPQTTTLSGYTLLIEPSQLILLIKDLQKEYQPGIGLNDQQLQKLENNIRILNEYDELKIDLWIDGVPLLRQLSGRIGDYEFSASIDQLQSAPSLFPPVAEYNLDDLVYVLFRAVVSSFEEYESGAQ